MNFTSGDGVAACVNQWEVQNDVLARFSSMPSWTTMLILYFYHSLRKILHDFDNQNFFANFYSNVILKRKKLVLTLKSTGKMFSIMIPTKVLCHVDDLMHGFVTSWENVLFTLENIGTCVKITWNYFPCLVLLKVKVFFDYAQGLIQLLLLNFTSMISFLHCLSS